MKNRELGQKTRRELLELARHEQIHHPHAMTRGELVRGLTIADPPPEDLQPCSRAQDVDPLPQIPPWYGETRLVLLVRDPHWLFTYWEIVPSDWQKAEQTAGSGSERILRVYNTNGAFYDQGLADHSSSWYLETGSPGHSFYVEIGLLAADGNFIPVARSNTVQTPPNTISAVVDEAWLTVDELYRRAADAPVGTSSAEIGELLGERLRWELSSGAVSSISSPMGGEAQRDFWLVVNAELILYGATEPGAKVTVGDQEVNLNNQGEFSLRFALPDGSLSLPVVASGENGEEIKITPTVEKRTN